MIVTFYSYKGGVGRSMAVANVADLLARSGLRVMIIDFDLEAPGLEHFFDLDHDSVRSHEGLLDLLLAFKYAMSLAADSHEPQQFRELERYVVSVYPTRDGGGCLDLLPAGQRETTEQLVQYGIELRRFDWIDFYFTWSGELFFEWLRQRLDRDYDIVLVDSRTGVTEMGGICAYQLADVVVALCAPNLQNLDGTEAMVRHFVSPDVVSARQQRPLDVVVVPARVEQGDEALRVSFEERFSARFGAFAPAPLTAVGLRPWDLQIPYEPRSAFDEQVVTDPARIADRRQLARSYGQLLEAVAQLAPDNSRVATLRTRGPVDTPARPIETHYDPRSRFAGRDVLIVTSRRTAEDAALLASELNRRGASSRTTVITGTGAPLSADTNISGSRCTVVFIAESSMTAQWRDPALRSLVGDPNRCLAFVIPRQSSPDVRSPDVPYAATFDLRDRDSMSDVVAFLAAAVHREHGRSESSAAPQLTPFVGTRPFTEADATIFTGREAEVARMVDQIRSTGGCCVSGVFACGKSSAVLAGLIPALRRDAVPGSGRWPVAVVALASQPLAALCAGLAPVFETSPAETERSLLASQPPASHRHDRLVVVVDQFEVVADLPADERDRLTTALTTLERAPNIVLVSVVREGARLALVTDARLQPLIVDPVMIGALSDAAVRAAIELPLLSTGYAFEPGLVEELAGQVAGQPGQLTLLQSMMQTLWEQRRDGYLTWEAYLAAGGVASTLERLADVVVARMDEPDRQIAKRVLLRLVSVGSAGATVAVRRTIDDVIASAAADRDEEPRVRSVIDRLLQGRGLAVTVTDSGERVLALAHDALASRWPQLQRWVSEDRDQLRLRSQLEFAASAWEESGKPRQSMLAPRHVEQIVQSVGRDYLTEPELEYAEAAHRRRRQVLVAVIASVLANIILVPLVLLGPSSLLVFGVVLLSFVTFGVAYLAVRLVERLRQP